MATRVFLVRHGETECNALRRIQGHTDTALSARGVAQAECVAGRLADEPVAAVYSSDLRRAFQTAEAIASRHGLRVVPEVGLREVSFGEWEGKTEEDLGAAAYAQALQLWRADPLRNRPPGGESIPALLQRVGKVFDRVVAAHTGQTVVIVGHGGSMRAVLAHALGGGLETYAALRPHNASLSLIEVGDSGVVLQLYNDTCFLNE